MAVPRRPGRERRQSGNVPAKKFQTKKQRIDLRPKRPLVKSVEVSESDSESAAQPPKIHHEELKAPKSSVTVEPMSSDNAVNANVKFADAVGLDKRLIRQLSFLKFETMTKVQAASIPLLSDGTKDGMIRSVTGSGKTLAFLVPSLNRLLQTETLKREALIAAGYQPHKFVIDRSGGTRVMIISPTRELAVQTHAVAQKLTQTMPWITSTVIVGGTKRKSEKSSLRKGVVLLVATPGRILDHFDSTASFSARRLQTLVMDEVDRLLDLGFESKLRRIVSELRNRSLPTVASVDPEVETLSRPTIGLSKDMLAAERAVQRALLKAMIPAPAQEEKVPPPEDPKIGSAAKATKKRKRVSFDPSLPSPCDSEEEDTEEVFESPKGVPVQLEEDEDDVECNFGLLPKSTISTETIDDILETVTGDDAEDARGDAVQSESDSDSEPTEPVQKKVKGSNGNPLPSARDMEKFEPVIGAYQTLLVSATLSPAIEKLAAFALREGAVWVGQQESNSDKGSQQTTAALDDDASEVSTIDATPKASKGAWEVPATLKQAYLRVSNLKTRLVCLLALLKMRVTQSKKTVVFMNDCDGVEYLHALAEGLKWPNPPSNTSKLAQKKEGDFKKQAAEVREKARRMITDVDDILFNLSDDDAEVNAGDPSRSLFSQELVLAGLQSFRLHGSMSAEDRLGNITDFTNCKESGVLFTTDVAARGLNLPNVDLVIQVDPPVDVSDYVHRIGRTARMGSSGTSLLFLLEHETEYVDLLQQQGECFKGIKQTLQEPLLQVFQPQTARSSKVKSLLPSFLKNLRPSDAVSYLLSRFTMQVEEDEQLSALAQKAYLSHVRGYRVYAEDHRKYFDAAKLHLGHLAGSFFIKKSPADIGASTDRSKGGERGRGGFSPRGRRGSSTESRAFQTPDRSGRGGGRGFGRGFSRDSGRNSDRGFSRGSDRGFSRGSARGFSRGSARGFSRGSGRGSSRGSSRGRGSIGASSQANRRQSFREVPAR